MTRVHIVGFHVAPQLLELHAAAVRAAHPDTRVTRRSIVASPSGVGLPPGWRTTDTDELHVFRAPAQFGILSGAYVWFAEQIISGHNSLAEAVLGALAAPGDIEAPDVVIAIGWSAGGAFVRELARLSLPPSLWALVCLDGAYGSLLAGPGVPRPEDVAVWVDTAIHAAHGNEVLAMNATRLDYVETLPAPYASTADVMRHILATLVDDGVLAAGVSTLGSLRLVQLDHADHVRACAQDGPPLTAWAAGKCLAAQSPTEQPPDTLPTGTPPSSVATPSPTTSTSPLVHEGDSGPRVVAVQRVVGATADGLWGPGTTARVRVWLAAAGLPVEAAWSEPAQAAAEARGAPPLPAAEPRRARGADVSRAQGPGEANAWASWSVDFGFARASSGTDIDPTFAGNWFAMGETGLVMRGAYHYLNGRPLPMQVAAFANSVSAANMVTGMGTSLPNANVFGVVAALDIEPWDPQGRVTDDWVAAMNNGDLAIEWIERVADITGRLPLVYSADWALSRIPTLTDRLVARGVQLWCADGTAAARSAHRPILGLPTAFGGRWLIHQRGTRGAAGEPLPIDEDEFNGTVDELRAFARAT